MVARATVVQNINGNVCVSTNKTAKVRGRIHSSKQGHSRTVKEPRVEDLCLEGQWQSRLNNSGWSNLAIMYHSLSLAETNKKQYSSIIQEYMIFCGLDVSQDCPPMNTAFMANFIANIGSKPDRPKSKVNIILDNGSMSIMIHGNKNDYNREGSQVNVSPATY